MSFLRSVIADVRARPPMAAAAQGGIRSAADSDYGMPAGDPGSVTVPSLPGDIPTGGDRAVSAETGVVRGQSGHDALAPSAPETAERTVPVSEPSPPVSREAAPGQSLVENREPVQEPRGAQQPRERELSSPHGNAVSNEIPEPQSDYSPTRRVAEPSRDPEPLTRTAAIRDREAGRDSGGAYTSPISEDETTPAVRAAQPETGGAPDTVEPAGAVQPPRSARAAVAETGVPATPTTSEPPVRRPDEAQPAVEKPSAGPIPRAPESGKQNHSPGSAERVKPATPAAPIERQVTADSAEQAVAPAAPEPSPNRPAVQASPLNRDSRIHAEPGGYRVPPPAPREPGVQIGQVDVFIEAPEAKPTRPAATPAFDDAASRQYLRRL